MILCSGKPNLSFSHVCSIATNGGLIGFLGERTDVWEVMDRSETELVSLRNVILVKRHFVCLKVPAFKNTGWQQVGLNVTISQVQQYKLHRFFADKINGYGYFIHLFRNVGIFLHQAHVMLYHVEKCSLNASFTMLTCSQMTMLLRRRYQV